MPHSRGVRDVIAQQDNVQKGAHDWPDFDGLLADWEASLIPRRACCCSAAGFFRVRRSMAARLKRSQPSEGRKAPAESTGIVPIAVHKTEVGDQVSYPVSLGSCPTQLPRLRDGRMRLRPALHRCSVGSLGPRSDAYQVSDVSPDAAASSAEISN